MKTAPLPPDEDQRLAKLHSYNILDTLDEQEYNEIAYLTAQICGTPMSNISFVDRNRQWFKAVVGLKDRETPRDVAFCAHTILGEGPMIVPDATQDERFHDNPLVINDPAIRFYAGMPLTSPDGHQLGSLCAIDTVARSLTQDQQYALKVLADHVVHLLELRRRTRQLEELSEFKSRMLAIVAHDLRSPVAALSSLLSILKDQGLDDATHQEVLSQVTDKLMTADYLIDNIVGWATKTLGTSDSSANLLNQTTYTQFDRVDLKAMVLQLKRALLRDIQQKGNNLEIDIDDSVSIDSDGDTLQFILRNLVANANKFTSDGQIRVSADQTKEEARVSVSDTGWGMSQEQINTLFDWQVRRSQPGTDGEQGSGLALLLCRDMAHRIGGEISVVSEEGVGSTFTLSLPRHDQ